MIIIKLIKANLLLAMILLLALFLRTYQMPELMVFGGDVARDYLVARDITLKGDIPLLGSPTSVPWLFQGAFFTYLLGIVLWLGKYNPLSGGYFVGVLGVMGALGIYFLGKKFFSEKVGLWAAFFYSTSPLIVLFDRYPYHQSLISLFTILFVFSLWKMEKNVKYTVLSFFLFGLLMQLELSNLVLLPVLLVWLFIYRKNVQFKLLVLSVFVFLFTWLPKIIYDLKNGFTQTLGFFAWVIHRLPLVNNLIGDQSVKMTVYERIMTIISFLSRIVFWPSVKISTAIFILFAFFLLKECLKDLKGKIGVRLNQKNNFLLLLWILVPLFGFLVQGSPSESYVPVLFGAVALLVGVGVSLTRRRLARLILAVGIVAIGIFNSYFLLSKNFFVKTGNIIDDRSSYNLGLSLKLNNDIARFIVDDAKGRKFNIIPIGGYGDYSSSVLNTSYLTWYLGNEPSENKQRLQYFIYERDDNFNIKKADLVREFPYIIVARKEKYD